MKVLLVDLWGREGMLHYVSQLANAIDNLPDMQVELLLPAHAATELVSPSIFIHRVPVPYKLSVTSLLLLPVTILTLAWYTIRNIRCAFDIVHLNNVHPFYFVLLPLLKRQLLVCTLHDVTPHIGTDNTLRKRLEIRYVVGKVRHLFVHGENLIRDAINRFPALTSKQITAVPHGDYSFLSRLNVDASSILDDIPDSHAIIIFFGRIREYKGLGVLLKAWATVSCKYESSTLVIAGDGELESYLDSLATLQRVKVINRYVEDHEIAALFNRATIAVLPYLEASQSGVIYCASAFNVPVIASNVGAIPDIIHHEITGLLVEPANAAQLESAILRILTEPELAKRLGTSLANKTLRDASWSDIAIVTGKTYNSLIKAK